MHIQFLLHVSPGAWLKGLEAAKNLHKTFNFVGRCGLAGLRFALNA